MEFNPVERAKQFLGMYNEIQSIGHTILNQDLEKAKPYNHKNLLKLMMKRTLISTELTSWEYRYWTWV